MSGRRRGGPVRQLSLQQSTGRRHLRKQGSEDRGLRRQGSEDRSFWGDHGLRVLASSIVSPGERDPEPRPVRREAQPAVVRPRPVRIAWTERRQVSCESDVAVGVVVQRCKGLPRPITAKPVRTAAQPDSILYSRQQLAERLRLAWKDRQERPNLDIFLAHNSFDKGDEEVVSAKDIRTEVEKTAKAFEDGDKFTPLSNSVNTSSERFVDVSFRKRKDDSPERPQFTVSAVHSFPTATFPLAAFKTSSDSDKESATEQERANESRRPRLTPSITISFDHETDSDHVNDNDLDEVPSFPSDKDFFSDHLLKPDSYTSVEVTKTEKASEDEEVKKNENEVEVERPKQESLTATVRRANFRNSNNNPVMSGSVSVSSTPPSTPISVAKVISKKPSTQPLTRMMSAPVAGRSSSRNPSKDIPVARPELRTEVEPEFDEDDFSIVQRERNVKSAPARRKFKGVRRKGPKGHEDDSSEDEVAFEEPSAPSKPRNRKRFVERGADIVTMVSLLSPNESEVEDPPEPVIQLPQDPTWTRTVVQEVRPEAKEAEAKPNPPVAATTPITPGIVSLRKFPVKTVSFQQGQQGARSYTASFPSRRGAGTPLILPPPEPPAPPLLSTVPPPPALRSRRPYPNLLKAKSAGSLGQENSCDSEPPQETVTEVPPLSPPVVAPAPPKVDPRPATEPEVDPDLDPNAEPDFKTAKERECWQMFRKMVDKGVSVSYDTVLRGMLTPTEYRLHKKSVSSTC